MTSQDSFYEIMSAKLQSNNNIEIAFTLEFALLTQIESSIHEVVFHQKVGRLHMHMTK